MQNSKLKIKPIDMAQIAVCTALLCVLSPLSIPTPISIAFTLQVLIVLLCALILKPLYALTAQILYTLLGFMGLPVFSGWQSGFGIIASPTGGFLIGFLFASFLVSLFKGKCEGKFAVVRYIIVAIVIGIPCIYLPGILGFMLNTGADFVKAFQMVAALFLPIDVFKCVIAALFAVPVNLAIKKINK